MKNKIKNYLNNCYYIYFKIKKFFDDKKIKKF